MLYFPNCILLVAIASRHLSSTPTKQYLSVNLYPSNECPCPWLRLILKWLLFEHYCLLAECLCLSTSNTVGTQRKCGKNGSQKWWYARDNLLSEGTSHCAHKLHLRSLVHITSPLADAIIPEWHSHHVICFKYSALSKESTFLIMEVATSFSHSNPTCMRTTLTA